MNWLFYSSHRWVSNSTEKSKGQVLLEEEQNKKSNLKNRETGELKTQEDIHALSHMSASIVFP